MRGRSICGGGRPSRRPSPSGRWTGRSGRSSLAEAPAARSAPGCHSSPRSGGWSSSRPTGTPSCSRPIGTRSVRGQAMRDCNSPAMTRTASGWRAAGGSSTCAFARPSRRRGFGEQDEASLRSHARPVLLGSRPTGNGVFPSRGGWSPPGGLFYATLTFAGATRFGPAHELDRRLLQCYHASMGGERGGDPYAGERLLGAVRMPGSGFAELASGRSDWRVVPTDEGYPDDEAYFLLAVLGFVEKETPHVVRNPRRRNWTGGCAPGGGN